MAAIAGLRAGRVQLAAFASGSATLLAGALARLREAHPGVELTFVEAEPQDGLRLLREGETDLVLAFSTPPSRGATGRTSRRSRSCATRRTRSCRRRTPPPGSTGRSTSPRWPGRLDRGLRARRRHLLHVAEEAGFTPRIDFETDDYLTVQSLVAACSGVSLPPALALCSARRDDVAVRPWPGAWRTIEAILPAADRRPPAVTAALAALQGACEEMAADADAAALGLAPV